jgi:hypothetical protein
VSQYVRWTSPLLALLKGTFTLPSVCPSVRPSGCHSASSLLNLSSALDKMFGLRFHIYDLSTLGYLQIKLAFVSIYPLTKLCPLINGKATVCLQYTQNVLLLLYFIIWNCIIWILDKHWINCSYPCLTYWKTVLGNVHSNEWVFSVQWWDNKIHLRNSVVSVFQNIIMLS